jgi:hypothetical protein
MNFLFPPNDLSIHFHVFSTNSELFSHLTPTHIVCFFTGLILCGMPLVVIVMLSFNSSGKKTYLYIGWECECTVIFTPPVAYSTLLDRERSQFQFFAFHLQDQLFHPLLFFRYNVLLIQLIMIQHVSIHMKVVVQQITVWQLDGIALWATRAHNLLLHNWVKPISAVPIIQVGGMVLYQW